MSDIFRARALDAAPQARTPRPFSGPLSRSRLRTFAALCAAVAACHAPAAPAAGSLADTIEAVKPSIVGVGTVLRTRRPPGTFVGTGFVVADGRHVVTNAHVLPQEIDLERREFLAVFVPGAEATVREAELVGSDEAHDLAVLRMRGAPLPALAIGDSDAVREGDRFAFTGFPIGMVLGLRPVTHRGIVSAITPIAIPQITPRSLSSEMIRRLRAPFGVFQLDATSYPGNSGSPLYDVETGRVIGVLNMVFVKDTKESVLEKPSGIGYAIPARHVLELLSELGVAGG